MFFLNKTVLKFCQICVCLHCQFKLKCINLIGVFKLKYFNLIGYNKSIKVESDNRQVKSCQKTFMTVVKIKFDENKQLLKRINEKKHVY